MIRWVQKSIWSNKNSFMFEPRQTKFVCRCCKPTVSGYTNIFKVIQIYNDFQSKAILINKQIKVRRKYRSYGWSRVEGGGYLLTYSHRHLGCNNGELSYLNTAEKETYASSSNLDPRSKIRKMVEELPVPLRIARFFYSSNQRSQKSKMLTITALINNNKSQEITINNHRNVIVLFLCDYSWRTIQRMQSHRR